MRHKVKNTIGLLLIFFGFLLAICTGVSGFQAMAIGSTYILCKVLLGAALFSFAAGLLLLAGHSREQ